MNHESSNNSVWKMLNDLSRKQGITEIVINSPDMVFVERAGQFIQLNIHLHFADIQDFINDVYDFNRRDDHKISPIMDGKLPDGSRINIIRPPYVVGHDAITIRKYLPHFSSFEEGHNVFGLNSKWVEFLRALVSSRINCIVAGGTGVGKTTFMNLLLHELPITDRIVTIEDTIELSIAVPNCVRLECRNFVGSDKQQIHLQMRDLIKNALRMRPDRIIIGEVRGGEIFDLLQAMNTGHEGSMSSIHANSTSEALLRMETLYSLAGMDMAAAVIKRQIAAAVDIIIQLGRDRNGHRIVSSISELTGMEGDNLLLQDIGVEENGILVESGLVPSIMEKMHQRSGISLEFFS
ncbi:MAG: hypothetical protein A2504_13995 [Bdellovibrionales bacterium RIFOXYD12_FULL_39_22]|nr:MAG: hypothetical protein A2385_00720 [Bdellovibrionales bacterium RIFOXYB1_FULL_39_21]OFZ43801.1 MAG: hypothetical protein A2485_04810 [Bdellovibrionales bacterium RIFOXYC12_FULL_39_17]OFZ48865.1 MAG: hypothetical protein A2404_18035 [Bdellovibrionales bacterium RIFOXYC1_FULL_39_130]OFZ76598.1 MAG: hypothetical protein A2560_06700 [Bdellovibrionales bacterium RIFOXYD1_FULL_39_84]OFZ94832.1 MAG: hypothetical protein A2504_13995 [Bdellovibrionales bacterium RIFOXYD12_FULL_39_22]HLE12258.1 AT